MVYTDEDAALHAAVMKALAMSPAEVFSISVKAGVRNEDGTLTKHYQTEPEWFQTQSWRWFKRTPIAAKHNLDAQT